VLNSGSRAGTPEGPVKTTDDVTNMLDELDEHEAASSRLDSPTDQPVVRVRADDGMLHTAVVPATFVLSCLLAWVQHRLVAGAPSTPLLVFLLPGLFGIAMGTLIAWLLVSRRSAVARATIDELTKLRNRGAVRAALVAETERSARYGTPFGVIVFDVDHFKAVNDTHGHGAGDTVLMHIGNVVSEVTRGTDIVGRWGGDEFVVVAPGTGAGGCRILAEKIRHAVATRPAPGGLTTTISVGCAGYVAGDSAGTLLERADEALFAAKRGGRNRSAATRCLRSTGTFRAHGA
jgi:diguanylate cyclase (GGDEF)-like protein